jgi:hypothetical protein
MTSSGTGVASHTFRSKLVDEEPIPAEAMAVRHEIERQDRAFVVRLRAAILAGAETEAEGTLRRVLAHRAWVDQRRGWRFTNPRSAGQCLAAEPARTMVDLAARDAASGRRTYY